MSSDGQSSSSDRPYDPAAAPISVPFHPGDFSYPNIEDIHDRPHIESVLADIPAGRNENAEHQYGGSSTISWSLYLEQVKLHDKDLTKNVKDDTNGILVFTGLFAAIVAAFIIESYGTLQPDAGEVTVALLTQISRQLAAASDSSQFPIPSQLPDAAFRPSSSAIRVNILWFTSLLLSLSCALAATLMQQWARRYATRTEGTQRAGSPQRRGRLHAYIFMGLQTFHMMDVLETLPALIHASVALFFAGLVEFLFSINTTVAYVVFAYAIVIVVCYVGITSFPFLYPNSPYATPLSSVVAAVSSSAQGRLIMIWAAIYFWRDAWIARMRRDSRPVRRPALQAALAENIHRPHGSGFRALKTCTAGARRLYYHFVSPTARRIGIRIAAITAPMSSFMLHWLVHTNRSSLVALEQAADASLELDRNTVAWTLQTIIDDDTLFERFLDDLPSIIFTARHSEKIVEVLFVLGCGSRIAQLLDSTSAAPQEVARKAHLAHTASARALMYLHYVRQLALSPSSGTNPVYWAGVFDPVAWSLKKIRQDNTYDPDVVCAASCTAANMVFFLDVLMWRFSSRMAMSVGDRQVLSSMYDSCLRTLAGIDSQTLDDDLLGTLIHGEDPLDICSIARMYSTMTLLEEILRGRRLLLVSTDVLTVALDTVARIPVPLFEEEFDVKARSMGFIQRGVLRLQSVLRSVADEKGVGGLEDRATASPGQPTESRYQMLYDSLRPLHNWVLGFEERSQTHLPSERAFPSPNASIPVFIPPTHQNIEPQRRPDLEGPTRPGEQGAQSPPLERGAEDAVAPSGMEELRGEASEGRNGEGHKADGLTEHLSGLMTAEEEHNAGPEEHHYWAQLD